MGVKISLFANAYDEVPTPWEGSWDEFCTALGPHRYDHGLTDKLECPAFCPTEFQPGAQSKFDRLAVAVHMFGLDVDHSTEKDVMGLVRGIQEAGLAACVYTTWRHAEDPWRVRILLPLSRSVPAGEWAGFWERANAAFGGICDPKCRNVGRIYFGPYAPKGTEEKNFFVVLPGAALDVDLVWGIDLGQVAAAIANRPSLPVPRERFEKFAKQLSRRQTEYHADLGEALLKICRGEPFAEHGERDEVIFRLAGLIVRRWPDCDPVQVAGHFGMSLQVMAMAAPDCPTVEDVAYKIRRARDAVYAERQVAVDERTARVKEAFGNCRSHAYTADELKQIPPRRWIIQKSRSFYFRLLNDYVGPFTDSEVLPAAVIQLAPASSAGVELFKPTKNGIVQKTILELVRDYGTVALRTEVHLSAQVNRYDEESRTFIEAPCPIRPIVAMFHPEIDLWLKKLAGPRYEKLKTWLAAVTDLDHPCVALLLTGKKGVGKGLLAQGVSRLWSRSRPTSLEEVFSNFNEALTRCPLCFADEQLPKDFRGYSKTAELRHHIQTLTRPLTRKHLPTIDCIGAMRTIVAANNEDVLSTPENLSANDIEAIIERYLHIPCQDEAAEYLESVDTWADGGWVFGDKIAEHVLWLVQNHVWFKEGRFLIKPGDDALGREFSTRSGSRSSICQWLVGYLREPGKFDNEGKGNKLVRVKDQRLLVNTQALVRCWDHYVTNEKCPSTGAITTGLIALCVPNVRPRYFDDNNKRVNYRVIDIENLIRWAEKNGYADREQILDSLKKDTEDRISIVPGKKLN